MKTLLTLLALVPLILSAGCSSFKVGAVCYLPAGHHGNCTVMPAPAASAVK